LLTFARLSNVALGSPLILSAGAFSFVTRCHIRFQHCQLRRQSLRSKLFFVQVFEQKGSHRCWKLFVAFRFFAQPWVYLCLSTLTRSPCYSGWFYLSLTPESAAAVFSKARHRLPLWSTVLVLMHAMFCRICPWCSHSQICPISLLPDIWDSDVVSQLAHFTRTV
jgi:hypothetical protein